MRDAARRLGHHLEQAEEDPPGMDPIFAVENNPLVSMPLNTLRGGV